MQDNDSLLCLCRPLLSQGWMPLCCSCARSPSAASSWSLLMQSQPVQTSSGLGRKPCSTAGEKTAALRHCLYHTKWNWHFQFAFFWICLTKLCVYWLLLWSLNLQDGCGSHPLEVLLYDLAWKRHCLCHRSSVWPCFFRQKVRWLSQ